VSLTSRPAHIDPCACEMNDGVESLELVRVELVAIGHPANI
jgi:hypothetical protein